MQYDYSVDDILYEELDQARRSKPEHVGFNRTLRRINKIRTSVLKKKPITVRTFRMHLKKMKDQGIVHGNPPLPGHKGHYQFTEQAVIMRKLGIFEGVDSRRNKKYSIDESKNKARKKAIILLLTMAATGSTKLKRTSKIQPGDVAVRNTLTGKLESFEVHSTTGVSAEDVTRYSIDYRRKIIPKNITNSEIQDLVNALGETTHLSSYEAKALTDFPIIIADSLQKGELVYRVQDAKVKKFFTFSQEILAYAIWRMELTWKFIRLRLRTEEIRWYCDLVGKENTIAFFEDERRKASSHITSLGTRVKESKIEQIKTHIKVLDSLIISRIKELDEESAYVKEKIGYLYDFTIGIVYPMFLRDLHKKNKI